MSCLVARYAILTPLLPAASQIYGLFKYLTVSHTPNSSRPGLLDFAGRAKWDAWKSVGEGYRDRVFEVEERYLQIAIELGWKEGERKEEFQTPPGTSSSQDESDDGDIWDKEDEPKGGGIGFGVTVSKISQEGEETRPDGSFHTYAVAGDTEGLKAYLESHAEAQVDTKDEYGYTALHMASDRGHIEIVKLLLDRGANSSIKDTDGFTALELAQVAEHDEVVQILDSRL